MAVILLVFIVLVLVLSIPFVQTALGKYATRRINEDFGTNINIGKVGLQFNGDVELKEIYIEDYKQDTLIAAQELNTSILSFKKLYDNKLNFGDIDIDGLFFNIKTYKDATETNLDIFVAKLDSDKPKDQKSSFVLSSSDVTIENSLFRITDQNKENPLKLDFNNLYIRAKDFLIAGPDVSAAIKKLAFKDSRGVEVKDMSTDFKYTLSGMTFQDLSIKTPESNLSGVLSFTYNREDLQHFTDKVTLSAHFDNTTIAMNELNTFYNEFGKNKVATFTADFSGTLNDLQVNNLKLNTVRNTKVYGDVNFKNLFNAKSDNFMMRGDFTNLSSNYRDLKALLPNILGKSIPSSFDKLGNFTLKGSTNITSNTIETNNTIATDLGLMQSKLTMNRIDDVDNATYQGNIVFTDFDLGQFLNDKALGNISLNMDLVGKGFTLEALNTTAQGNIYTLNYNDYTYHNITVAGNFQNKKFNGKFQSSDQNLKLDFDGLVDISNVIHSYDFKADVKYANLNALNFVSRDSISIFNGIVDMKMQGTNIDDAFGSIDFTNTKYENQNDTYYFKDFKITSSFNFDNERLIEVNSPDIIEGKLSGKFLFNDIGKLIENSIGSIYTNYKPNQITQDQYIDFNFKIYNKIVDVFFPDIKLGKNTFVKGRVENDEKDFKLTFKSPQIKLFQYFADDIQVKIDNKNPLYNTYVQIDSLNTKFYNVSKFNLINVTLKDTLFIRSQFKGGKRNKDQYNLSMYYTINEANKSVLGFKKSDLTFRNNTWFVNETKDHHNKIVFERDFQNFEFDKLFMTHNDEEIKLSGTIDTQANKNLKLDFKTVDLAKITPEIDSLKLEGIVDGKVNILQDNGVYLPTSTLTIHDFKVNRTNLGAFNANIKGNESLTNYSVDIRIKDDKTNSFEAVGNLDVSKDTPTINVDLMFDDFNLEPLNPFGEDVITNIRGLVKGQAKVSGNLNRPSIDGHLSLDQAGLKIPYLNVDYAFQDQASVSLRNQSFIFNNVAFTDSDFDSTARLNGSISHVNFSDWSLDLDIATDKLLVLNTKRDDDVLYYGTGFIGGNATIKGPTDQLVISVDGQTRDGTVFKIPLTDTESFGDNSFIHFLTKEEKESKLSGKDIVLNDIKGLELDFDLDINEDAEVEIIIDPDTGHSLKGRGAGNLLIEINTNGKFNMWGDFLTFEGVYNFMYGGLIQKQFQVEPGGTLTWDGDPLKAQINIKAIYNTRANPTPLLDNPISKSIPVDVVIDLSGELEQPDPNFSFEFPNVASTLKSELQYRLNSKEERDNQALYLLSTGAFSRGLNDLSASGTIAERLSAIVNNIFSDADSKLNIGLNYEVGERRPDYETDDRVGFTLQTQLSDRVLINGQVGVPIGGVSQTVIAGDVQIDFLLNEEGSLRAKVFNRENSIRNFGEEIGYTQGLGLSYNVDFNTFKELLNKIFKGKPKVKATQRNQKQTDSISDKNPLPKNMNFKSGD